MDDVTLSAGGVAAMGVLLTGLCGAIGLLYRNGREREKELTEASALREKELTTQLIAAKNDEISRAAQTSDRLMSMLDRLIPAVEETSRQVQRLVTLIETWRPGRHE